MHVAQFVWKLTLIARNVLLFHFVLSRLFEILYFAIRRIGVRERWSVAHIVHSICRVRNISVLFIICKLMHRSMYLQLSSKSQTHSVLAYDDDLVFFFSKNPRGEWDESQSELFPNRFVDSETKRCLADFLEEAGDKSLVEVGESALVTGLWFLAASTSTFDKENDPFKLEDDAKVRLHGRRGCTFTMESAPLLGNLSVENASGFVPGLSRKIWNVGRFNGLSFNLAA